MSMPATGHGLLLLTCLLLCFPALTERPSRRTSSLSYIQTRHADISTFTTTTLAYKLHDHILELSDSKNSTKYSPTPPFRKSADCSRYTIARIHVSNYLHAPQTRLATVEDLFPVRSAAVEHFRAASQAAQLVYLQRTALPEKVTQVADTQHAAASAVAVVSGCVYAVGDKLSKMAAEATAVISSAVAQYSDTEPVEAAVRCMEAKLPVPQLDNPLSAHHSNKGRLLDETAQAAGDWNTGFQVKHKLCPSAASLGYTGRAYMQRSKTHTCMTCKVDSTAAVNSHMHVSLISDIPLNCQPHCMTIPTQDNPDEICCCNLPSNACGLTIASLQQMHTHDAQTHQCPYKLIHGEVCLGHLSQHLVNHTIVYILYMSLPTHCPQTWLCHLSLLHNLLKISHVQETSCYTFCIVLCSCYLQPATQFCQS